MPEDDRAIVGHQLGRPPRAFRRVAVRCPFGRPAVTEQWPYDRGGEPFPTTYYLTCRHLVAAVSRLEAAGGVERWSSLAAADPRLAESLRTATAHQREVRQRLAGSRRGRDDGRSLGLGIGGSRDPGRLKCLHAHVAFALAVPEYELGRRITAEVTALWPDRCCTRYLPRPVSSFAVEHAQQQWQESYRRFEGEEGDPARAARLHRQLDAVLAALRRRVGETFTLAQLAEAYSGAEDWAREAIAELDPAPGWPRTVALVTDAAFHVYARGAVDYQP